jgi:thymidylate kinase
MALLAMSDPPVRGEPGGCMSPVAPAEPTQGGGRLRGALRVRHKHRWVGFEGIVASGKTTQARILAANLKSPAEVVPEFGNHELGRYLSSYGSPGMRLAPEGCESSYVRHLLALSSHMQKLRNTARSKNTLLDVATLTDAAFALADLPEPAAQELRPIMRSAVDSLIELVHPPAHRGVLIYLDCDPKVAAERLARRNDAAVGAEQVDFLGRMHDAYEYLLSERRDFVRVDANREIDEVALDVRAHVRM